MTRSTPALALALSLVALPAIANAPAKTTVRGKSAYAQFSNEIECVNGASTPDYQSGFVAFQESHSKDGTTFISGVTASVEYARNCDGSGLYLPGSGATDGPSADPTFHLIKNTSTIDPKLKKARVEAVVPIAISGVGICTATVKLDLLKTNDKPIRAADINVHWSTSGHRLVGHGTTQPAVATGSIAIGPLQLADGTTQPCDLPPGVPTEYAVGNVGWFGDIPATFLSETQSADFYRTFK